jgi:DNA mismatch repair protein MutL
VICSELISRKLHICSKCGASLGKIKLLSDRLINQIAAGEIVERPCSVVKEIVENSIDAHAKNVNVFLKNGGKSKIVVEDDGDGLSCDDLSMSVQRHATSKLDGINLFQVQSYGFRGEALPSIGSVSDLTIESSGFGISVRFAEISDIWPSKITNGTIVSVKDLFGQLPARLKFLKSDNAELSACLSVVENFAVVNTDVNFDVRCDSRVIGTFRDLSLEKRMSCIFGEEMFSRSIYFEESDETISLRGYLFHPIDSKYSSEFQKMFVNSRVVKDKIISAAMRNAYRELIPLGRYPAFVIFVEIDPFYTDLNVSPTKSEVRFRDAKYVQKMITVSVREALKKFDRLALSIEDTLTSINHDDVLDYKASNFLISSTNNDTQFSDSNNSFLSKIIFNKAIVAESIELEPKANVFDSLEDDNFFGNPVCQIFDSYIITQKDDSIIIIDQHAVHEKIEQMRITEKLNASQKQYLITPVIIQLNLNQKQNFINNENAIIDCGFEIGFNSDSEILTITAIPSVIDETSAINFLQEIIDTGENLLLGETLRTKIANKACHNSIRFGRRLSIQEMQALISQMEDTPTIHQCNHHRPSFIRLTKTQLGKMFHRN